MFSDYAKIHIRSGKGGDGHVSFRRELYIPAGGPDGGDGGKGGDVIFQVDNGLNTLYEFRHKRNFSAGNGQPGGKRKCHGKDGEDLIIKVPQGTVIREESSGLVIADMNSPDQRTIILKGGRGGKGNMHYATPTMQAPKYAQPGQQAMELDVILELKCIADVGLAGFPNVGKSTLLSVVSNARPKIANYHFTTLEPNLGVVDMFDGKGFVMADIPGLIEGASEGQGLGLKFLRHIERTRLILHVIDISGSEGRDPLSDIKTINRELREYSQVLSELPQIIAANKCDIISDDEINDILKRIKAEFPDTPVYPISAATRQGVDELLNAVFKKLSEIGKDPVEFEAEFVPSRSEENAPINVYYDEENDIYMIEGPRVERMLGYTNLDNEKGFEFFQNFMRENSIIDRLRELGISEGDTVGIYNHRFEFYDE